MKGFLIAALLLSVLPSLGGMALAADTDAITAVSGDGLNLVVEDQIAPDYVVVRTGSTAGNWFAGTFTRLPVDTVTTIGLSLAPVDTVGKRTDVSKWQGLAPVFTYADPTAYEGYEWFHRDAQGRWVSGDPLKVGDGRYAGEATVPEQRAVPVAVAAQFLSADGKIWCPWGEMAAAEAVPSVNVFRMKQRFALSTATVAMRVPFTYTFLQQFLARLRDCALPGVCVDDIGTTVQGRKLQAVRVQGDPVPEHDRPTVLIVAREHATEHASSWVLYGMLAALLADTPEAAAMRARCNWIFIPIEDPDGSADSTFDRLTTAFHGANNPTTPPEVFAYVRYLTNYVYGGGRTIDLAVSLHNVEANETPNLFCPFIDMRWSSQVIDLNRRLFGDLVQAGYRTGAPDKPWDIGRPTVFRLYGWCADAFGGCDAAFEVNDRYPQRRLSLPELQQMGSVMATTLAGWWNGESGSRMHAAAASHMQEKTQRRAEFFRSAGYAPEQRTPYDLLIRGY